MFLNYDTVCYNINCISGAVKKQIQRDAQERISGTSRPVSARTGINVNFATGKDTEVLANL